eukprot:CAMPEP_0198607832 /NCGR_PEP_ID=MMETSP1462-20131121/155593_1 /TAXON_ID=1333877 /ORGANISM="Brandtodinium nutriculum, Strain RCC3387" /LENGTH=477 /DNA_ID=CAMNT_0044339639 /DNA_START=74 /DNA_END=1506 /DNA_ORIENTATION=-
MGGARDVKGATAAKGGKGGKASGKGGKGDSHSKGGGAAGKGKGKEGASGGKGKGKDFGKKGKGGAADDGPEPYRAQDADADVGAPARGAGAPAKQPLEAKGARCEVKKHSEMGCAVVSMDTDAARDVVLAYIVPTQVTGEDGVKKERREITIGGHTVQVRPHVDKEKRQEVKTDLFVAWGHKAEKMDPLPASTIAETFDQIVRDSPSVPTTAPATMSGQMAQAMCGGSSSLLQSQMGMPQGMSMVQQMAAQNQYFSLMAQQQQQAAAAAAAMMVQQQQQQANLAAAAAAAAAAAEQQAAAAAAAMMVQQQQQQANLAALQQLQQLQQQRRQVDQGVEATPPRTPPGAGGDRQMRADAEPFMYSPASPSGQASGMDAYGSYNDTYNDYGDYYSHSGVPSMPERKPLNIVDPKSGQPIEVPPHEAKTPPKRTVKGRSKLAIINPSTKEVIDPIAASFEGVVKDKRAYSIINPTDGSCIK